MQQHGTCQSNKILSKTAQVKVPFIDIGTRWRWVILRTWIKPLGWWEGNHYTPNLPIHDADSIPLCKTIKSTQSPSILPTEAETEKGGGCFVGKNLLGLLTSL